MKKVSVYLLISILILSTPGCTLLPFKKADGGAVATGNEVTAVTGAFEETEEAIAAVESAEKEKDAQTEELLSKVKANVVTARASNENNPDGVPKIQVEGELRIAETRLQEFEPDPVELAEALQRNLLVEQGKTEEARRAYDEAVGKAEQTAIELADAEKRYDRAIADLDAARAAEEAAITEFDRITKENQDFYESQLNDVVLKNRQEQTRLLNWGGIIAVGIFASGLFMGGAAGLMKTWPALIISFICFGLSQVVAEPSFVLYAQIGVAVGLAALGWWIYKQHQLEEDAKKKDEELTATKETISKVIPVLDSARESADENERKLIENSVLKPLGNKMDANEKAMIHMLRAARKQKEVAEDRDSVKKKYSS